MVSAPSGVAVIDKPAGCTSHDVVAKARKVLGTGKVGHSGTLDPDATGVLVLGVGKATRLLRFVIGLGKSYEAEIVMGVETDTLDAAGKVTARHDMSGLRDEQVREAALSLTGDIMQVPPMVSAVKIGGRRLHELARAGVEVERPARPVTVYRFDVVPVADEPGVWRAHVDCSSGTYVRVLAADLGRLLGGGAHIRSLRRTAVGHFTISDARSVEAPKLLPMATAVSGLAGVVVDEDTANLVRYGRVLSRQRLGIPDIADDMARHHSVNDVYVAANDAADSVNDVYDVVNDAVDSVNDVYDVVNDAVDSVNDVYDVVNDAPDTVTGAVDSANDSHDAVKGAVQGPWAANDAAKGPWAVHDLSGSLLAVYEPHSGGCKPAVVVAEQP